MGKVEKSIGVFAGEVADRRLAAEVCVGIEVGAVVDVSKYID